MKTEYKHTAGPWAIAHDGKQHFGHYYIRQDPVNWDGNGYQAIGRNVSELHASTKGSAYGEMFKANARLIAASPSLLDALIKISQSNSLDDVKAIATSAIKYATEEN